MKGFVILGIGMVLAGCGNTGDLSLQAGQQTTAGPGLAGRVLGSDGTALAGVTVIAQERTTGKETQGLSGADGSFALTLDSGVYDVGLDQKGNQNLATAYYGPVTVVQSERRDFVVPGSAGHDPGQVFGKIFLQPGVPATARTLTLRPGSMHGGVSPDSLAAVSTTTGAQGDFALTLSVPNAAALDVEVGTTGGQLQEFIDIAKRTKACYVEFALEQSPVKNLYRCNQAPPPAASASFKALPKAATTPVFPILPFDVSVEAPYPQSSTGRVTMANGGIAPGSSASRLKDISKNELTGSNIASLISILENTGIRINNFGSWGEAYSIEINPNYASFWVFHDVSGEPYTLSVYLAGSDKWHRVSYDSFQPGIVKIQFSQ